LDERLRDYAQRWQSSQPPAPPPRLAEGPQRSAWFQSARHVRLTAIAAGIAAVAVVVGVVIDRHGSTATRVSSAEPGVGVPVAKPPLLHRHLSTTPQIELTSGRSGTVAWTFFALYAAKENPAGMGPGLCLGVATALSSGSGCDDPNTMPSLTVNVAHLDS